MYFHLPTLGLLFCRVGWSGDYKDATAKPTRQTSKEEVWSCQATRRQQLACQRQRLIVGPLSKSGSYSSFSEPPLLKANFISLFNSRVHYRVSLWILLFQFSGEMIWLSQPSLWRVAPDQVSTRSLISWRQRFTQYKHSYLNPPFLQGPFQRRVSSDGILKRAWHIHANKSVWKAKTMSPVFFG